MPTETKTESANTPLVDATVIYAPRGESGNAFWIMGATIRELRNAGRGDLVGEYTAKATAGDYENLLAVTRSFVNLVEVDG